MTDRPAIGCRRCKSHGAAGKMHWFFACLYHEQRYKRGAVMPRPCGMHALCSVFGLFFIMGTQCISGDLRDRVDPPRGLR